MNKPEMTQEPNKNLYRQISTKINDTINDTINKTVLYKTIPYLPQINIKRIKQALK